MAKTIRTKVFSFSELSSEAKEVALSENRDINLYHGWWESVYYDAAETAKLKITSFDIDRGAYCEAKFLSDAHSTADKIMSEHGEHCDTYKAAAAFKVDYDNLVEKYSDGIDKDKVKEGSEYDFDQDANDLEADFLKELCQCYLKSLRNEYEYLYSDEAIINALEGNETFFTKDGKIFNY